MFCYIMVSISYIWWDDICFVLDQHAYLDFYHSVSAAHWHNSLYIDMSLYFDTLSQIPIFFIIYGLTRPGLVLLIYFCPHQKQAHQPLSMQFTNLLKTKFNNLYFKTLLHDQSFPSKTWFFDCVNLHQKQKLILFF